MLIRDLPTKWKLVRRGQEVYWQRYHYRERPTRIPDEAFSRVVEKAIEYGLEPTYYAKDEDVIQIGDEWMTFEELKQRDEPPRVVVPSAMRDWNRAKAKVIERASLWAFPMQIHLTPEYLQQFLRSRIGLHSGGLSILYTYSSSEEALNLLKRQGETMLRKQEPIHPNHTVWEWLSIDYHRLGNLLTYGNKLEYLVPFRDSGENAYLKRDYRLLWRHAWEWFPLLVDITARQMAWQLEEARRRNIASSEWANRVMGLPTSSPDQQLIPNNAEKYFFLPPVDARIRRYLSGDGLRYYEQVYKALQEVRSNDFEQGERTYHRFLAALGS